MKRPPCIHCSSVRKHQEKQPDPAPSLVLLTWFFYRFQRLKAYTKCWSLWRCALRDAAAAAAKAAGLKGTACLRLPGWIFCFYKWFKMSFSQVPSAKQSHAFLIARKQIIYLLCPFFLNQVYLEMFHSLFCLINGAFCASACTRTYFGSIQIQATDVLKLMALLTQACA